VGRTSRSAADVHVGLKRVLQDPRTVENPRSVPCVRHVVARDGEGVMRT
jgi:hypothetical protein